MLLEIVNLILEKKMCYKVVQLGLNLSKPLLMCATKERTS